MKTKLFSLLLAVAVGVGTMFAEKVQIGDLYYNLNATDQTAEVTYKSYANYSYNEGWNITTANIPASVTYNGTTYSVTSIGSSAFRDCISLTSVTIPNSVTSIGNNAFYDCSSLTSVTIPNSVTSIGNNAFYYCSSLTSVTIPNSVTSIGNYAFNGCGGLTSVTIPNSVTSIGESAFMWCISLTSVTIPNSVTSIGSSAFDGCSSLTSVTIPNSVTSIGNNAFYRVDNIIYSGEATGSPWGAKSVNGYVDGYLVYSDATKTTLLGCSAAVTGEIVIPNSVTSIGQYAFYNCSSLTSVTIPNSVTSIGDGAFHGCSGLTSVTIPNSVTSIGSDAFEYCSSLNSVTIPNSVTSIGEQAFSYCSSLTSVTIGNSVTSIGSGAFEYCSSLTSVTIPNSVTSIGDWAFRNCRGLTSVTLNSNSIVSKSYSSSSTIGSIFGSQVKEYIIGEGVTSIGQYAFYDCFGLTSVTIPNSVTSIGRIAFSGCSSLNSVTIPNSVTSIADYAFSGCSGLTSVTIPNSVTSIGNNAFYRVNNIIYSGEATGSPWGAKCVNGYVDGYLVYSDETKTNLIGCSAAATGEIVIPNSVTSIGDDAFNGCSGLTKVNITDIAAWCNIAFGSDASNPLYYAMHLFVNDIEVTELVIPNSVTSIGNYAFKRCSSLTSVTIPNSVTSIGEWAFASCSSLTSIEIPNSVTSIGSWAFDGCSSLTSVTIPNSVTSIGNGAFSYCSSLTSVTIPNSVTSIGNSAFSYCSSLTSVTIPNSVTSIGSRAFYNCSSLTSVTCEATAPPTLGGSSVFSGVDKSIPVYVPGESVDLYKAADRWKEFTNILPMEETPAPCILASGTCGAQGNNLIWELSCDNLLTISGSGAMADYSSGSAPWYTNRTSITSIIINNGVTSIGNYAFENCSGLTSVTIPNSVTSIGTYAFQNCSSLTSVTIGNSVTSIGNNAFYQCSGLTKVNITDIAAWCNIAFGDSYSNPLNNAKHIFVNDIEVTELIIPNGVTSIGKYAFYNCSGLSSVTIPSDVSKIGANAFYRVNSIIYSGEATGSPWGAKSVNGYVDGYLVYSDDTKTTLLGCSAAATGEIVIPSSVTSIGNSAFYNCSGLTSVTIPNSVTSIGESAFSNCTGLTKVNITDIAAWCNIAFGNSASNPLNNAKHLFVNDVEVTELIIPNGATSIGQYAFYFYPSLSSVTIPNSVTSIGNLAFCGCSSLTSVTIPNSVTSIGNSAFNNCNSLISVTIPNSVTSIGNNAFGGVDNIVYFGTATGSPWGAKSVNGYVDGYLVYSDDTKTTLLSCSAAATGEIIIPNSVTSIGERAFSGCSGLTSVNIPNSVTSIGEYAFSGCSDLTSVTIGNSVTSIGEYAFYNCSGLTSVTIPNSVTSIGDRAFYGCSSLNSVTIPNSVTSIGSSAFSNCTGLTSVTIPNSVTSIGESAFSNCTGLTKVNITDIAAWCNIAFGNSASNPLNNAKHLFVNDVEVTELVIPNGVTSIGQYAYYNCSSLTSVTIPNSVTSIGKYAFSGCSGLTSVNIPNSVTSIGERAFSGCSGLTSVTIPNSVTSIGNNAFYRVNNIIYSGEATGSPWGAKSVNGYVDGYLVYSDATKTTLLGCSAAATGEIVIPSSVTSIGNSAFYNCSSLTSVTIPNSVTSIGKYAFSGCSGLTSVNIPNSVTSIGERAFSGCSGLTSVTIPNSVTSIGNNAFYRVNNIIYSGEATGSPWGAKSVNGYVDGYLVYSDATKTTLLGCSAAATGEIVIPNSVTSIGQYAFYNCSGLTSVTIPNSVTSIGESAFSNCTGLTDIYVCGDLERFQQLLNNDDRIKVGMPYTITINAEYGNVTYPQTMCDDMSLTATPEYGYHFVKWSDGNTANPRAIELTRDTTFTAQFAPNQYTLSLQCDDNQGTVEGAGLFDYLAEVQISATPAYGYHFSSWSDGNTDNPRTISVTEDKSYSASFAKNTYTITKIANNEQGSVSGPAQGEYLDNITLTVTPEYGYHFAQWNDGNTDNPRTFVLTKDTTFTAQFAPNQYTLSLQCDDNQGSVEGAGLFDYLAQVQISATPNYGYYFVKWSDGVTDNPRTFVLTQDTTFTAEFAKNTYTISTTSANPEWGTTAGGKSALYLDEVEISATPNYGYHFVKWSDGNTDNPRTIVLTQDTTFIAEFAKNTYTISTESANPEWGTTAGGTALYLDNLEISATPNYGYHFVQWNDGNTTNPRTVLVTEDKSYTATFAKNTYSITKIANNEQGSVSGPVQGEYLDNITLTVTSEYGYHFAQWNDGNTANPRTFELTKDTTFTAQFAPNQYTLSLQCDDNQGTVEGAGVFDYLAQVQISATPAYGYHFVQWNDGNTTNPRTVSVTEDKSYSASFAKNTYTITKIANNEQGSVSGPTQGEYLDNITLTVTPEYGYHFAQWNDGNTANPRTIVLTQDTTFIAEFAKNTYTISTESATPEWGTTAGGKSALYLDEVEISATPNYGYHFVRWNDNNTSNPRIITLTQDTAFTAMFAKNIYSITKNAAHGTISGNSSAEYLDYVTLTVTPDYGYHFTQWSDGLKDNPRIFRLTQDTTFTAEFAYDRVGQCGKDMALIWSYDPANKVLTIGNAGEFTENMQFGAEAPTEMEELVIGNNVTAIGENAFAGISTLKKVSIGESVKTIGEQAFYNCVNLETIFNYRPTPTNAYSTAFDGVDKFECILYVLPNSIDMYKNASVWRDFYYTYAIGAEETTVTTNDVQVEPQDNAATLTWPTSNNAVSYTIEITKDGVVFCRLTFNANGQLTGIAFAPGRDGQSMAPAAVMTANGLQFTVTGLDSNTQYGYNVTAKDANEQPIATYSGNFTTTSEGVPTGIDNTAVEPGITKILRNGEVLILRDGKTYTIQGVEVR